MAKIYEGTTQLIGGTPLVEFKNIGKELGLSARILAKLEYFDRGCGGDGKARSGVCDH